MNRFLEIILLYMILIKIYTHAGAEEVDDRIIDSRIIKT